MQLNQFIFKLILCSLFLLIFNGCNAQNENETYKVINVILDQYNKKTALYYKSTERIPLKLPLSEKELVHYDLTDQYNLDSLITDRDIQDWNEGIKSYTIRKWNPKKIKKKKLIGKIPSYMKEMPKNPKTEPYPIHYILYLSTPFFNESKDKVLILQTKYYSPMNVSTHYFILALEANNWVIKAKGLISYS